MIPPPPRSTLFPYTTLFRSCTSGCLYDSTKPLVRGRRIRQIWFFVGSRHIKSLLWPHLTMPRKHRNRSEEHTSELQSRRDLVCRLLLEKKKTYTHDACAMSN